MKKKKVLYMKAQGLGDMISGIPKLLQLREQGYEIYQSFYDVRHLTARTPKKIKEIALKLPMFTSGWLWFLELLKKQKLVDHILYIPFGFLPLCWFVIKNFKKFDEVIIPIKTLPGKVFGTILGKHHTCIFDGVNDISKYRMASDGELGHTAKPLFQYKNLVPIETEKVDIDGKYVAIFSSLMERSPELEVWKEIINYLNGKNVSVVVVGGERESWFRDWLKENNLDKKVYDYIGKTNLKQVTYILENSICNIVCNGGMMWVSNLVNKHNINIHTVSAYLMEPPVDNQNSFNIRPYDYPSCKPCEAASMPQSDRIPSCVFYNTKKEGICRKSITFNLIKKYIELFGV